MKNSVHKHLVEIKVILQLQNIAPTLALIQSKRYLSGSVGLTHVYNFAFNLLTSDKKIIGRDFK